MSLDRMWVANHTSQCFREQFKNPLLPEIGQIDSLPSVAFIDAVPGQHGGIRHVLKRCAGRAWGSNAKNFPNAPQGDPRFFIELMGVEVADYFGFCLLNSETLTVPDSAELNGAIASANEELHSNGLESIAIEFYEQERLDLSTYLENFAQGKLPLHSSLSTHRIHDLSFHTGCIAYPTPVLRHAQRLAVEVSCFAESVTSEILLCAHQTGLNSEENRQALCWTATYLKSFAANRIDLGSSELIIGYMDTFLYPETERGPRLLLEAICNLYLETSTDGNGWSNVASPGSPSAAVSNSFRLAFEVANFFDTKRTSALKAALASLEEACEISLQKLVEAYVSHRTKDSWFVSKPPLPVEKACGAFPLRLESLRDVVSRLKRRKQISAS